MLLAPTGAYRLDTMLRILAISTSKTNKNNETRGFFERYSLFCNKITIIASVNRY